MCDFGSFPACIFFEAAAQPFGFGHVAFAGPVAFTDNGVFHPLHVFAVLTVVALYHLSLLPAIILFYDMRWNFSGIFLRLLCSTKESGVSFKMSSVSFLVSAPCTPSLSRNRINLQLYRLHWLYLYGPVAKDRALPFISNWNPCCLSVSDCHFLWASWLMFRATFTLWLSSHVVMAYWSV